MRRPRLPLCLCLLLMSVPLSQAHAQADDALFAYDPATPEPVPLSAVQETANVDVIVESRPFALYPGQPDHPPLHVTIVRPMAAPDAAPGILWGHWLGEPATSGPIQYLEEAVTWARRHGVTSVLIETLWSDPRWYEDRDLANDFAHGVRQVILFRRAIDLLLAQPGVDPDRLAFVAHDYSAMYGSIALAVDPRIKNAVFIAAAPDLLDWAFYTQKPADMDAYLAQNQPLLLATYLGRLSDRHVLLQWAEKDVYVPPARRDVFIASLTAGKIVKIYPDAGHAMTEPTTIREDRTTWLKTVLGLH